MINDHLSTWLFDDIDWNAISHRRILIRNTIDLPGTSRLRRRDGSELSISNEVTSELDFDLGRSNRPLARPYCASIDGRDERGVGWRQASD